MLRRPEESIPTPQRSGFSTASDPRKSKIHRGRRCLSLRPRLLGVFLILLGTIQPFWQTWRLEPDDYPENIQAVHPSAQTRSSSLSCPSLLDPGAFDNQTLESMSVKSRMHLKRTDDSNKPWLILHIGPSKTGTTTLQKESVRLKTSLEQDNYVYLGKYAPSAIRIPAKIGDLFRYDECYRQVRDLLWSSSSGALETTHLSFAFNNQTKVPDCWKDRMKGLQTYRNQGKHVLLSDEAWSYQSFMEQSICRDPLFLPTFRVTLEADWKILVVGTYRRYSEWMVSVAKEYNQKFCQNPSHPSSQWPLSLPTTAASTTPGEITRTLDNASKTTGGGGSPCPSIWQIVDAYRHSIHGAEAARYWNIDTTLPVWFRAGYAFRVLYLEDDMGIEPDNEEEGVLTRFFCKVLPEAPYTCQKVRSQPSKPDTIRARENTQTILSTVYDDLVVKAAQRGWIVSSSPITTKNTAYEMTNVTRPDVVESLRIWSIETAKVSLVDLPLQCPPHRHLTQVLDKAIQLESRIVPKPKDPEPHRRAFWKWVESNRIFCSIDTDRLFHGLQSWPDVLARLQELGRSRRSLRGRNARIVWETNRK